MQRDSPAPGLDRPLKQEGRDSAGVGLRGQRLLLAVAGATRAALGLPQPPPNEVYAGVLGPSHGLTIASRPHQRGV
jgi:hypothetical protein